MAMLTTHSAMELLRLIWPLLCISVVEGKCGGIRRCTCVKVGVMTVGISCINRNFAKVPPFDDIFKKNIEHLILRGNFIRMLDMTAIEGYVNLRSIDVRYQKHGLCVENHIMLKDIHILGGCEVNII